MSLSVRLSLQLCAEFRAGEPARLTIRLADLVVTEWVLGCDSQLLTRAHGLAATHLVLSLFHTLGPTSFPPVLCHHLLRHPTSSLSLQRPLSHPCVVRFPPKIPSKFKAQQASSLHLGSSDRRSEETDRVRLDRRLSRRSEGKGGVRRDGWLLPTATSSPSRGTRRGMRRQ